MHPVVPEFPIAHFAGRGRWVATIQCRQCEWIATMRGDDALEVGSFLRGRAIQHLTERHEAPSWLQHRLTGEERPCPTT